ncbi:MAG: hypothetical protein ACFFEJ_13715 [Candidatus Thorarchaeota archaeon]
MFQSLIIYIASLGGFLFFSNLTGIFLATIPRIAFGAIAILIIPGSLLGQHILPSTLRNILSSSILGLILAIFQIQALFVLGLALDIHVPLLIWMVLTNVVLFLILLSSHVLSKQKNEIKSFFVIGLNKTLLGIITVSFLIRILMAVFSIGAISPDACVYADYARSMIDGDFLTHVQYDSAVYELWNGFEYAFHQAFVYLFAVSWLLAPPTSSGPILILIIIGTLLVYSVYELTKSFFGEIPATTVAFIISINPLYVFHSAVAYGPEITSLLFIIFGILLLNHEEANAPTQFLAGLMFGLVDVIWYANFYMLVIIIPIFLLITRREEKSNLVTALLVFPTLFLARAFFDSVLFFYCLIVSVLILLSVVSIKSDKSNMKYPLAIYCGTILVIILWRGILQTMLILTGNPIAILVNQSHSVPLMVIVPIIEFLTSPFTLILVLQFIGFSIFHITPAILLFIFSVIYYRKRDRNLVGLVVLGVFGLAGTFFVFASLSAAKTLLELIYLYSDSRFFISPVLFFVISLGSLFQFILKEANEISFRNVVRHRGQKQEKQISTILIIIMIGFVPCFALTRTGIDLVQIEKRYAWQGLVDEIRGIGTADSFYLVERAGEFTWLTNRQSMRMRFSEPGIPSYQAYSHLLSRVEYYDLDYIMLDLYTIARWNTAIDLLQNPLEKGDAIPADVDDLTQYIESNQTKTITSFILRGQTPPNSEGDHVRIYEVGLANYEMTETVEITNSSWIAGNGGNFIEYEDYTHIAIGYNQNYTFVRRALGPDLNMGLSRGFLVFDFKNATATIARIEVYNPNNEIIQSAMRVEDNLYYCMLGNVVVGDIIIVLEGVPGDYADFNSVSVWQGI